jgi:hypothetical protein
VSTVGDLRGPRGVSAGVGLERHYRRLLLAYPLDYRERRAEEMLATLLDDAAAGQRRPTWDEAADLIVGGIRQRLQLPRLPMVWVAALLSALILGAFTAGIAGALGWTTAGALPDNQAAAGLVTSAFAPQPGTVTTRYDKLFGYDAAPGSTDRGMLLMGDDTYTAGYVQIIAYPDERHGLQSAAVALRRAGWHVDPPQPGSGAATLTASTARLTLQARVRSTDNRLIVTIHRAPPRAVAPLTVIGWITGALAGWLLAAAVARRAGQQRPLVQMAMQAAVIFGLVLLTPATAAATLSLTRAVIEPASSGLSPPWSAYTYPILLPAAFIGAVFAIVAAALATLASPPQPLPAQTPAGAAPASPRPTALGLRPN